MAKLEARRRLEVEAREEVKPWCYLCGREADRVVVAWLPCPWCAVDAPVKLCPECAERLAQQLLEIADRLKKGATA